MPEKRLDPVYILGPGALGLSFAHQFSAQRPVTLITKAHHPSQFTYTHQGASSALQIHNVMQSHNIAAASITELWLFAKAHQIKAALLELTEKLHPNAHIVVSHNGMSDTAELEALLTAKQSLYFMLTQQAAFKPLEAEVVHVSQGASIIGAVNTAAMNTLNQQFVRWQSLLPNLQKSEDINRARWHKLLINLAINPIAAYYSERNGGVRSPRYASDVFALLQEALHVADAQGVSMSLTDALNTAYQVMANTAENHCSMLQDKRNGKETEIDAMCGYILRKAQQYGLAAPINQRYYQRIKGGKL
ncbi:ketopantoate reductase family protein [Pseudoalteromonas sp. SSDWG2]|uniref:ketopantoate reductase family protein n=1 Tax=Pseudoalteromonas sp. SSDWG2 TaxID=3139391 RepID=UPI003BAA9000